MVFKIRKLVLFLHCIFIAIFIFFGAKINYDTLIEYNGNIEHLTFQTLIAFPEKAFNTKNNNSTTLDETKITSNEFSNILNELYNNNYILIKISDLYFVENNIIYPKPLHIPKNKKPIILSFDNASYKSSYQNQGQVDKIIIDKNNQFASYTTKRNIQDRIAHNNEFIPLLENFILKHPDFSHNNARGIIFFTGENGLLGYETHSKNKNTSHETKRACEVVRKLENNGWEFGSNNYKYISENSISDMDFAKDISLWIKEIKPIIGDSHLYAYPNGKHSKEETTKQKTLIEHGFKVFFENSFYSKLTFENNTITMHRKPVNGTTIRNKSKDFDHLFNCNNIYDHNNRTISFS